MTSRRGVALIFVLGLMIALGIVAAEVGRSIRTESALTVNLRARTVARYAAESGVEAATAAIETLLDSLDAPGERIAAFRDLKSHLLSLQDVRIREGRFGVAVTDLNARVDLNRTDPGALETFLRQFSGAEAGTIVAALRKQPIARIGELPEVPGVDDALAMRIAPYVTVWSDGLININSAPESVLAALPGFQGDAARGVVERRDAGETLSLTTTLGADGAAAPTRLVTVTPRRLLVIARGWQAGFPLTHEIQAVFSLTGNHLELQAWQERDL